MVNDILVFSAALVVLVIIFFAIFYRGRKKDERVSGSGAVTKQERKRIQPPEKRNEEHETEEADVRNDYLLERVYRFSQRNSFWDGKAGDDNIEKKAYKTLKEFIDDAYIIIPHVAFREVFFWDWGTDWRLTNRVTKMHFDFGIYNEDMLPIFFLEIHGKEHKENPREIERDKFKAEVLKKCDIKLITVDCSESMTDSEIRDKLVSRIKEAIPDRKACPTYCPNCKRHGKNSLMVIRQKGAFFYGCSTYSKSNQDNCPTLNLDDVPPLYWGIPLFKDKDK